MEAPAQPPVVVVTGPTATGKTPVAIELAQRFGGEIINADSVQVYRFMDVGTAKPSADQRAAVPHHLLDVVTPDVSYSAGRYVREARAAAALVHDRDKIVFLTGGTGLYIRAFLEGLIGGSAADLELRERLESEAEAAVAEGDPGRLHRRLVDLDPSAADRIHPNDARRIVRALEIAEQTGELASRVRSSHRFTDRPYRALHLALDLPRGLLDERIDARCEMMIGAGLLQEMRDLQERGYGVELRSMKAIGYRHMVPVVQGADTLANALVAMQRDTRRFARRQRTWLRRVPEAIWVDASDLGDIAKRVEAFLEAEAGAVVPPSEDRGGRQNGTTV